jgi:hypothetical protein
VLGARTVEIAFLDDAVKFRKAFGL